MMKENIAWFILHEVGYQNETILSRIGSYRTGSSIIGAIACAVIVACVGLPTMSRILISVLMLASTSVHHHCELDSQLFTGSRNVRQ